MKSAFLIAGFALGVASLAWGQGTAHRSAEAVLHTPDQIVWKPGPASLPSGARYAVLEGDPTQEGPFTLRIKLPDGYRIPPHMHPKTERLTVLSGTFRFGMGERFDEKGLRPLPAGSYAYWPAGMRHFVSARGETVVQLHGIGPWQIIYVNPADDPRQGK